MQSSKKIQERIAALPLGSREREQVLRNFRTAESFIDVLEGAVTLVRQGIRAAEQLVRGLHRQHKVS